MNICVTGQGVLAEAVAECLEPYQQVSRDTIGRTLDALWVCYDVPLSAEGEADYAWVHQRIAVLLSNLPPAIPVLISSQMPVGTIRLLEEGYPGRAFAYMPENVRSLHAVFDFRRQDRIVVGRRTEAHDALWYALLRPFTNHFIWTDPETAEMVKHALNAYLGMNIAFINEIGKVAKAVNADVGTISAALMTERRVSPQAPLHSGHRFSHGHLARDLHLLVARSAEFGLETPLLDSILPSNDSR